MKFYSDNETYLIGSDEGAAFDSGLQTVDGNLIGIKYERRGEFDYVGLILSEISDPEVAAALAASQAAKAELMDQYNAALANSAAAEQSGDLEAAAQYDAEAA